MEDCLLQRLAVYFLEPSIFWILFQLRDFIGLQIPRDCLLRLLVRLDLLFKEIVIYEANCTKVLLKQLSLGSIWIYPKLICFVHLHIIIYEICGGKSDVFVKFF